MKRTLSILLLLVFCFAFCSCSAKPRIHLVGYGESGGISSETEPEMDLQFEFKQIGDINRTHDITIDDTVFIGKYETTCISSLYKCDTDQFFYKDDSGLFIQFCINRDTDEAVFYTIGYLRDYPMPPSEKTLSYDECYQLALEELGKRVNAEEYVPCHQENFVKPVHDKREGDIYTFSFMKMLDQYETNAVIDISVSADYGVKSYSARDVRSIDCISDISRIAKVIDSAETQAMLDEKIRSIYGAYYEDLVWTVSSRTVMKLRSGKEAIQYSVHVTSEGYESYSVVFLLMVI